MHVDKKKILASRCKKQPRTCAQIGTCCHRALAKALRKVEQDRSNNGVPARTIAPRKNYRRWCDDRACVKPRQGSTREDVSINHISPLKDSVSRTRCRAALRGTTARLTEWKTSNTFIFNVLFNRKAYRSATTIAHSLRSHNNGIGGERARFA